MFKRIKAYLKDLFSTRLTVLMIVSLGMFLVLMNRVFVLQIVNGQKYLNDYKLLIQKKREINGTRGKILDRNGEVLADNRLSYSVTIEDNGDFDNNREEKNKLINKTILQAIKIVEQNGDDVASDFGVILEGDDKFEFKDQPGMARYRFIADVFGKIRIDDLKREEKQISAEKLVKFLATDKMAGYEIDPSLSKKKMLQLVAIRYDMHLNSYQKYIPIVIADQVSEKTVAAIEEHRDSLSGISIAEASQRYYPDSKYFSPLIGYTGKISRSEYDKKRIKKPGCSLTDVVGKAGIEKRMDDVLEGSKGEELLYVDNMGKIVESKKTKKSKAGNNLYLTVDKNLSKVTYDLMEQKMAGILLSRLSPKMRYKPDPESNNDLITPIGDLYYNLISNRVLDMEGFSQTNAGEAEKRIYQTEQKNLQTVIGTICSDLKNNSKEPYKDMSESMQSYVHYIEYDFLMKQMQILDAGKIDMSDPAFTGWRKDGTESFSSYLHAAIKKNWINTSKLMAATDVDSDYLDADEIYNGLITYLSDVLKTDSGFELLVYDALIRDEKISGKDLCLALFEQGVITDKGGRKQALQDGESPYTFIKTCIQNLELTPGMLGLEPCQGSAVITDPRNGKVLACVSYPGVDSNRLANRMDNRYYYKLQQMSSVPFFNKATQVVTAPGSTFKPISAAAGLTEHVVTPDTRFTCTGKFTKIKPEAKCWIYPGAHGSLNLSQALAHSCNVYFSEIGYRLGQDHPDSPKAIYNSDRGVEKLAVYAKMFGLGKRSGIELPESNPQISDEDAVRSAFGQGNHAYTTTQLARYTETLANKGQLFDLSVLDHVENVSGKKIKTFAPKKVSDLDALNPVVWNTISSGMESMTDKSGAFVRMHEAGIPIAGKTGTAQESLVHADHVLFVGYAPAQNPEISLALRVSNGYISTYMEEIADNVLAFYFGKVDAKEIVTGQADIITSKKHVE